MSEPKPFDAMVAPILEGKASRQVKLAASRGALPLPRTELVRLFVHLKDDEDDEVRAAAESSLQELDPEAVRDVLSDQSCAPEILDHYAPLAARDEAMAEKVAFHPATTPQAIERLASDGNGEVIDLVLTNQERLLVQPGLLDKLTGNPALRADQRGRILELLERITRLQQRKEMKAEGEAVEAAEPEDSELDEAAKLLNVDIGELFSASEIVDGDEFADSEDELIRTAYAKILTLNVAQKAILAMRGGREERMILVRDSNQIVALAVLKNGRITEDDIESISRMRNVTTEVLRSVTLNRDWVKNHTIVNNLVNNPRTPPGVSTNFIGRLRDNQLKFLVGNRDAPELVRRMAKRTLQQRSSRARR